jgi:hypothetical protein
MGVYLSMVGTAQAATCRWIIAALGVVRLEVCRFRATNTVGQVLAPMTGVGEHRLAEARLLGA